MTILKIWLDDVSPAPDGWIRCYWPIEVIALLKEQALCDVMLSLDHDLGNDNRGTGYDVLRWIERQVFKEDIVEPPTIFLHTGNPVARDRMKEAIKSINRACRLNLRKRERDGGGRQ